MDQDASGKAGRIIALVSRKGGTGKTTLAAAIAGELTRRGDRVLLVDADPQASLSGWHGNGSKSGPLGQLELVVDASEHVAARAVEAARLGQVVVVDTAGFANRTQVAVLEVADVVLIPCRPSALDARQALQTIEMAATVNAERTRKARIGVVMNGATRASIVSHMRNELVAAGAPVLGSEIGNRTVFAECELYGSAPCWLRGEAAAKAAGEVAAVTTELLRAQNA